eukprot:106908-Pelagomonas_calceolata.AAC.2
MAKVCTLIAASMTATSKHKTCARDLTAMEEEWGWRASIISLSGSKSGGRQLLLCAMNTPL